MTVTMARPLRAAELKALIGGRNERQLAVVDVRPGGTFGTAHLLWAISVPLSVLELRIRDLVPGLATPVVLCAADADDDGLVSRAAGKLAAMGYTDLGYLQGGVAGWGGAGFEIFSGVNVPSKAFGEFIEHAYDTPRIPAPELKRMIDAGDNMIVLDSRPMPEFKAMNIPTGIDSPGAELALRVHDLAPDPNTTVVVNCAGRTRSIIGCQSLRNAGIPNKVVALENGTMGWLLAGFELERGQQRRYGELSNDGLMRAKAAAERVGKRFGVQTIDAKALSAWRAETGRTTYLFDVRAPEEYVAGHLPDAKPAPGGQLVQATDTYAGTLGARIVCTDDNGVRATMTASWLIQMGWEAYVYVAGAAEMTAPGAHAPEIPELAGIPEGDLEPKELAARMIQLHVIDLGDSIRHRAGHIPGSRFAMRANLPTNLKPLSGERGIALVSPDGILARLAAKDLRDAGFKAPVHVLKGGTQAWQAAGLPLKQGFENNLDQPVDIWYRPYDLEDAIEGDREAAMQGYLSWEIDLVQQIERDGSTAFRKFA